ncbi:hypothetical protein BH23GEM9_BH23GEM9_20670 [soil metagenome]
MRESVKDRATIVMAVVLVALVAVEFLLVPHEHPRFPWHHVPGYAAMIGLFACILVVQLSKALGAALLQKPARDDD